MTTTSKKLIPNKRFPEFEKSGEWVEKKLGAIGEIITGKTPSTSNKELWKNEILFVTPSDIKENKYQTKTERMVTNINIKLLPIGSIMFSCIATIGKMAIAQEVCTTNQQINSIIVDKEKAYNEFIYYRMQKNIAKIKAKYEKDAFSIINKTEFSNIIIHVSPLNTEQQKIADFLSSVDELIEYEKVRLEKLKEYKKGLLQNLFPKENQKVPDLRFSEFKNSDEWVEKKLDNIGNFFRGHSYSKKDVSTEDNGNTIVLRSNNIDEYRINYNDLQYVTKKCRKEIIVKNNDIIICMSNGSANLVGKNAYIRYDKIPHDKKNDDKDITVGAFCGIYRTENQIVKYFFQSDFYKKQLQTLFAGSNINNLKGTDILSMYIYTPTSSQEQQKIADFMSSVDELIEYEKVRLEKLKEYKKGLLQQLFPN